MTSRCRDTPLPIARQLRQEANFGCARCGCPVLENAHIIPYNITHSFPPEDMISLCPNHHTIADQGKYPEEYLRELKKNPYNKTHVSEEFLIIGDNLTVNIGTNIFINTPIILSVNDFDLISIKKSDNNRILLDVNFFDINNNLVANVNENFWTVYTTGVWDVKYAPQHLIIRNSPRKISLDIEIENSKEVIITGNLYFKSFPIIITKNEVRIDGVICSGMIAEDGGHGITCDI